MSVAFRTAMLTLGALAVVPACDVGSSADEGGSTSALAHAGLCDPAHPSDSLSRLLDTPIVPPRLFGDVHTPGATWSGLSLGDMERAFCDSELITEDETTATAGWGTAPTYAVEVQYEKSGHRIDLFTFNAGYKGSLDFGSRPSSLTDPSKPNPYGQHKYSIGAGRPILRDGHVWELNWNKACGSSGAPDCWDKQATEMFDALMYTFAPELPSTQRSCTKEKLCMAASDGAGTFGARPLGIYFQVANVDAPQPAGSTPAFIYGFPVTLAPFSNADTFLKLDEAGPEAVAADLGERHSRCVMKLGMTFQAFIADCVAVRSDAHANELLEQKVLQGDSRSVNPTGTAALQATWNLDVSGVQPNFVSERFDETEPSPGATATALVFGRPSSSGKVLNDYSADGSKRTLAGTGAVYKEYARLVQAFLHGQMDPSLPRFPLGDTNCLLPAGTDIATWKPARGCTGMEQFVIPADPSTSSDPGIQRLSAGAERAEGLGFSSALQPGQLTAVFCADPGTFKHCDQADDDGIVGATRERVIAVLGGGDESTIPSALRDRKVYVALWVKALVKYLRAAGQNPTDLADPRFDPFTPGDGDMTLEGVQDTLVTVKYADKFEYQMYFLSSVAQQLIFH